MAGMGAVSQAVVAAGGSGRSVTGQRAGTPPTFGPAELEGLPDLARRYFQSAIAPGSVLLTSARLEMRGRIKIGRWLPFRAREVLDPQRGFVWSARAAGIVTGSDRYVDREGIQDWTLAGLVTIMRAEGSDVSRSAAGRAAGEAIWLPAALLPRYGVTWAATGDDELTARYQLDDTPVECRYRLDACGLIRSFWFDRWGDPDGTGTWGWHRFGGEISAHRTFGSLTIPSAGRLGWHFGTPRWPDGEFFRFELRGLDPHTGPMDGVGSLDAGESGSGPPLDRLTTADLMMLRSEDSGWRQDIGALAVLDGDRLFDQDGNLQLTSVREHVARRLHLVPRFRQVLRTPAVGLGGPLWADATRFDIDDHVRVAPLAADADERDLVRDVERLRRRPFDRSRPLWEMWLCPGLAGGKVGLYVKLHHAIADGVAGVAQIGAFLDLAPDPDPSQAELWAPAPTLTRRDLLVDSLRRKWVGTRSSLASLTHPIRAARNLYTRWHALWAMIAQTPAPSTSVNQTVGEARRLILVGADLETVKAAAHAHAATVNDVLMTAVAGGYRALLVERGESVEELVLRASVPVSLHDEDPAGGNANNDGMIFVPLPVGIENAERRLAAISAQTVELKRDVHRPPSGPLLSNRFAQHLLWRQFDHQHWSNAYVANVPGPAEPLYFAGSMVETAFPIVPIMGNLTIGVGAMSYAGQFNVTVVADHDTCPDVETFVGGLRRSLDELNVELPHLYELRSSAATPPHARS